MNARGTKDTEQNICLHSKQTHMSLSFLHDSWWLTQNAQNEIFFVWFSTLFIGLTIYHFSLESEHCTLKSNEQKLNFHPSEIVKRKKNTIRPYLYILLCFAKRSSNLTFAIASHCCQTMVCYMEEAPDTCL